MPAAAAPPGAFRRSRSRRGGRPRRPARPGSRTELSAPPGGARVAHRDHSFHCGSCGLCEFGRTSDPDGRAHSRSSSCVATAGTEVLCSLHSVPEAAAHGDRPFTRFLKRPEYLLQVQLSKRVHVPRIVITPFTAARAITGWLSGRSVSSRCSRALSVPPHRQQGERREFGIHFIFCGADSSLPPSAPSPSRTIKRRRGPARAGNERQ